MRTKNERMCRYDERGLCAFLNLLPKEVREKHGRDGYDGTGSGGFLRTHGTVKLERSVCHLGWIEIF